MPKRHPSLIPLSRDHHDGLMLALRLRQGTKAPLKGWSHDAAWQAKYVVQFYKQHLVPHFHAEELALFPLMREQVRESIRTIETLLEQHGEIKRRVREFEEADEKRLAQQLREFGDLLDKHIRIEEDELFPIFEKSIPSNLAARVGEDIERIEREAQY
jgi:hemerythrin-like domain-containing protein